jgi:hypothetical protein
VSWRFAVIFKEMLKKIFLPFKTEENIEEGLVVFPPEMKRNQNNHFSQSSNFVVAQTSTESFFWFKMISCRIR